MNPYKTFLDTVQHNNEDYSVQTALDGWLEGLGPLVIPKALAGREPRKPWLYNEETEDIDLMNVQEIMNRISRNFCAWLKQLPGADSSAKELSEEDIRNMFDITEDELIIDDDGRMEHVHKYWGRIATSIKLIDNTFSINSKSKKAKYKNDLAIQISNKDPSLATATELLVSNDTKVKRYGAWYLKPCHWSRKKSNEIEIINSQNTNFEHNATTKAFAKFLTDTDNYKDSRLMKEILRPC